MEAFGPTHRSWADLALMPCLTSVTLVRSSRLRCPPHTDEPHSGGLAARLNWLRAGVLGANDGIVSTAGLVVGVAAATTARSPIVTAGIAGLAAGAVAMALGEYVSVSSQRDTERALLAKERTELEQHPHRELAELAGIYQAQGLSKATANQVARELTAHDAYAAHVHAELGIDPSELTNPWHAAGASAASFTLGALLPVLAILLPAARTDPGDLRRCPARAGRDAAPSAPALAAHPETVRWPGSCSAARWRCSSRSESGNWSARSESDGHARSSPSSVAGPRPARPWRGAGSSRFCWS